MLPNIPAIVSPLELAQLEGILLNDEEEQISIYLARRYFKGDQDVYLNDRALEFLGIHKSNQFRLNICRTIVTSLSEELNLIGFDTNEKPKEGAPKPLSVWARALFVQNKGDSLQDLVHEGAIAESESFIIVEWDPVEEYTRWIHNQRFISTDSGGDGMGVWMIYENDDLNQRPRAAVKQWIETEYRGSTPYSVTRRTIYFPDRIERWIFDNGLWDRFFVDGEEWPLPWLDGSGAPLGIPVFHFYNKGRRPEHWDAIPMQDGINKTLVDAYAAGDLTAFKTFFGIGFYPTTDGKAPDSTGSNVFRMGPAQWNGTMRPASEASLQVIEGSDVGPFYEAIKDQVLFTAQITETPASRFVVTAQVASADTIKEQDRSLKKKGADRRGLFGVPWAGVVSMSRKLTNLNSSSGLDEEIRFRPIWEHTETLDTLAQKKDTLEIPIEQIWREVGYTEEQIEAMKTAPSYRVAFEKALWEGWNQVSLSGIPLRIYLERVGLPAKEIDIIEQAIENQSAEPAVDL